MQDTGTQTDDLTNILEVHSRTCKFRNDVFITL